VTLQATLSRRDKANAYAAAYRAKNKDSIAITCAAYRAKNKDFISITNAAFYRANKESIATRKAANPEANRRYVARRRALKLANGFEIYTEQQVLETYGTDCHICSFPIDLNAPKSARKSGWENGLHIDHLIPLSKGGADILENVRPSHGLCNLKKSTKLIFVTH
jgi:5-methylcytosine-specific restriction endonuclease McrA